MLNRREFFKGGLAALTLGALAPAVSTQDKKPEPGINARLTAIAETLRKSPSIGDVQSHLVENPTVGLCTWEWAHFHPKMDEDWIPVVENANKELLEGMKLARTVPHAGLDELMHEGFVEGRVEYMLSGYGGIYRQLIKQQYTTAVPSLKGDSPPSNETLEKELLRKENLTVPVSQVVFPEGRYVRRITVSPLARLGAAYALSIQDGLKIVAAEHPMLDTKAEQAELSDDQKEFQRWVIDERNKHFVFLAASSKRKMVHLLVGFKHVLKPVIDKHNAEKPEKISQIVVTVKSAAEEKKKRK